MLYGSVIFIKKSGDDGSKFPVTRKSLKIGRSNECVIRIQNPGVSPQHCHLIIDKNGQAKIRNLSKHTPTFLNDVPLGKGDHVMRQGDVMKIGERCARWEYHPSSKYFNPEYSKIEETPSNALQKRKSEGAVAGISRAKKVDKRRLSEAGTSLGGKTLKISVGSTKFVARHRLELQKLGLCPQVRIKRCSILASPVPTVASRNGTPIRTSEAWEVKPLTPEEKAKSSPKEGTGRKDTPIKKPLGGQPVARNPCQGTNLDSIPEASPLTRKTSLERIRLDDVPECTTPTGATKPSAEASASPSKRQRGRPSKASIPRDILSTPMEKKSAKSSPWYSSSVKKGKINKTEKTPENRGNKRKLSAAATAERAAKKLKTIEPAKPDKNKKAALLVLGKASSKYKTFRKPIIALKQPGKNKKRVTKQISAKYNNKKKTKPEEKSSKKNANDLETESPVEIKEKSTPSTPTRSVRTRGSKVSGNGTNENDVANLSPGKSNKRLKNPVVVLQNLSNLGGVSNSSTRSTPKKRVGDDPVTPPSTSRVKKNVSFSKRGSRSSPRGQLDVSGGSSLELNEVRTPDVTLDRFVSPLVVLNPLESSPKAGKARESTVEQVIRKEGDNRKRSRKEDSDSARGARRSLATPKQRKSPKNDLTDVRGVRRLMESPRQRKSPRNDLTDVRGVRRLMSTPKQQRSPKNDLTDVKGVRKLMESPRQRKSPRNDLTDVRGVRRLMSTPKQQKSPANDLTDVKGVRKLMESPRQSKSPRNDLTDVRGVRRLMSTPKQQRSPKNDLTDVKGVRKLMESPRQRKSPRNDITDVRGVRRLMRTPREEKAPKNDLTDVEGVSKLFASTEDEAKAVVSTAEAGGVVAPAVRVLITRMSTRRTTKAVPAESEKENRVVRRSTRRTATVNIDEKVQDNKKGKPERKVTRKPSEKVGEKEKVIQMETGTMRVTRSASKTVEKRGARKK